MLATAEECCRMLRYESQYLCQLARAPGAIRKHSACSHRPPRTAPHMHPRPQLSTCTASCESGRLFPQSSTIVMESSPQITCRPHAGSPHAAADARCSLQPWRHMHIDAALRGHARGPASAHCIARKRVRHRRAGREIDRPGCCAHLADAKAFGAPAGRMQHETCTIASEGPCGSCSVLKIGMPMP